MRGPEAMRHFKSFKAWQLVLDWAQIRAKVDDPLVTCGVYRALFERAIYHYSTLLDTRGYIPRPFRREFFVRMTADFKKYAPPDYQLASGLRGIKLKLIRDGSYGRYSILDPINRARNGFKIASRLVGANFH
jgi:CDP-glycerol glycerophosphotransferase